MKKLCAAILFLLLTALTSAGSAGSSGRKLTVMIYMCGSNLESSFGSAGSDLAEIKAADYDPQQVTILVMAGGTSAWSTGYNPGKTHILEIEPGRSRIVWSDELLNMGSADALTALLRFGQDNYTAENYALILWDHGGGPLDGVCWDELFSMDSLTLSELAEAIDRASLPGKLSWLGFDACLMSSAEVASAMAPYAEYMIASQETEPASGWNYAFLNGIEKDENGAETGRRIVDAYLDTAADASCELTLSCLDLSKIASVRSALDQLFMPIGQEVTKDNFSRLSGLRLSTTGFGKAAPGENSQGYDLVDLRDLVTRYSRNTSGNRALEAISEAVVYSRSTMEGSSGLSVYHPFNNKKSYLERWRDDYDAMSFSSGYTDYIKRFGTILTGDTLADWTGLNTEIRPGEGGEGDLFTLQLTEDQRKTFVSAQLMIFSAKSKSSGVYSSQIAATEGSDPEEMLYAPVFAADAAVDENGRVSAAYAGRALYAVDEDGVPVLGPLPYVMSEDGTTYSVHGLYQDRSGREDFAANLSVMFDAVHGEGDNLTITGFRGYDSATKTFSARIPVVESEYTDLQFYPQTRIMPSGRDNLPGFESWETDGGLYINGPSIRLPSAWHFRFFPDQMSSSQLYAAIQITDNQRSTHLSLPVPIDNPYLESVAITPRTLAADDYELSLYLLRDTSPMSPGLNLIVKAVNLSRWTENIILDQILLNGTQAAAPSEYTPIYVYNLPPTEKKVEILHISDTALTGLETVTSLSARLTVQLLDHDRSETDVQFDIKELSLEGIAPPAPVSLAEAEDDGVLWELCSLEQNRFGDLTGLMRVTNRRNRELNDFGFLAVNGLLIDGTGSLIVEVPPRATAYLPFTMDNSAVLHALLKLNGRSHWYWMSIREAMSMYGLREIRDLDILLEGGYSLDQSARMALKSPWPLAATGEEYQPVRKPLMTGEVEASVEKVLRAENGVGLRLFFENHRDHAVTVTIGNRSLNGRIDPNASPFLVVPANGRTVYTFSITDDSLADDREAVTEVGMSFRVDDKFSTRQAFLYMESTAGMGYLEPADYKTEPTVFEQPRFEVSDPVQYPDGVFAASLSGIFTTGSIEAMYDIDQTHLQLNLQLKNLSDTPLYCSCSNIVINGTRVTDQSWILSSIPSGLTKSADVTIDLAQLRGIDEIREISFELSYYPPDDYRSQKTAVLRFAVESCEISAYRPAALTPLAEGSDGMRAWQLLSVSADNPNNISMLLRALNTGEEAIPSEWISLTLDGVTMKSFYIASLPPGTDQFLTVSFSNETRIPVYEVEVYKSPYAECRYYPVESHVLEHRGVYAISEIMLSGHSNGQFKAPRPHCVARLILKDPVPLDETQVAEEAFLQRSEGELAIYPTCLLVGENGVALCLNIVNDSDDLLELKATEARLNGLPCEIYGNTYRTIRIPPHTVQAEHFSILAADRESFPPGRLIRDLELELKTQTGISMSGVMVLAREAPLGAEGGVLIPGQELFRNITRAAKLFQTAPRIRAESILPKMLAPALDDDRVARFESGTASIMVDRPESALFRDEANPGAEAEYLPARIRLAQCRMFKDANGVVVAGFPGLIWLNAQGKPLDYYAVLPDDGDGDYIIALMMALYHDPDIPLAVAPEISLDDSAYDYSEMAAFLIHFEEENAEIAGALLEAYTPDNEEVTDQAVQDQELTLAAAEQMALYMRGEKPVGVFYDRYPVLSLEYMSLVPLADWPGPKYIYYEITYTDGTTECFFEPWPEDTP